MKIFKRLFKKKNKNVEKLKRKEFIAEFIKAEVRKLEADELCSDCEGKGIIASGDGFNFKRCVSCLGGGKTKKSKSPEVENTYNVDNVQITIDGKKVS